VVTQAVAWGEMDAYRHVNNVVYFRYFENVRVLYLSRIGWEDMRPTGVGPILQATRARFRRPLFYPDTISIGARATAVGTDRIVLEHRIVSHTQGVVTTEGDSVIVCFHYDRGEKVPVPDDLRNRLIALEGREPPALPIVG
jgi:acyl-CoA thioester hydrolase